MVSPTVREVSLDPASGAPAYKAKNYTYSGISSAPRQNKPDLSPY